jgi:uncharacterized protein (TIGR02270 family)
MGSAAPIPAVVQQHADDSASLRHVRSVLVRAPHVGLLGLSRLDERIAAHLDGLSVSGAYGTRLCTAALERPGAGEVFAVTLRALEERNLAALNDIVALAAIVPDARRGWLSALGWAEPGDLKGVLGGLLNSANSFSRGLAIDVCRLHRIDARLALDRALQDADAGLRAAALRATGEVGRLHALPAVLGCLTDADGQVALQAAAAALLLGNRDAALVALEAHAAPGAPFVDQAAQLLLVCTTFDYARTVVRRMARGQAQGTALKRRVIRACGLLGDTQYVPWLISLMSDDVDARLAGESFTLITGADLAALDLERKPPAHVPAGPTESPDDNDVALDEDESLPWPEQALVQRWWRDHAATMPAGERCFMGRVPTFEHCLSVLRDGAQRQRFVAAQHMCLLRPGTPLFPVCAPAWRQQRLLANWPDSARTTMT